MSNGITPPDVSVLLGHSTWLRRLAFHLVRGSDGAEDAVQDTWVAALTAAPSQDRDLRPWLGRVLQNHVRRVARTTGRRQAREQAAMALEPRTAEPGADALERLEVQRRLTELVTALDEPYRTTLVLRYFEGKSAAEIARQLEVPEGTIRWRTKEALDRLRARLDERHGGRAAWSVMLLPLARAWRPIGRWLVPVPTLAAAIGMMILLLGAGLVLVRLSSPGGGAATAPAAAGGARFGRLAAALDRASATEILDGVVLSPDGKGLAGAVVTARAVRSLGPGRRPPIAESPLPAAFVVSRADGGFRLTGLPAGRYLVAAAHPQHAATYLRDVEAPTGRRITLRLGTAGITLTGQIADEGGGPIPGARVMVGGYGLATFGALTTAAGEYRLVLPEPTTDTVVTADGYAPGRPGLRGQRPDRDRRVDVRLAAGARVSGRITHAGRPVAGALVRLMPATKPLTSRPWERQSVSDAEGRFTIVDLPADEFRVVARAGTLVNHDRTRLSLRAGGEERVELSLATGAIVRGRIRDLGGQPVPRAEVAIQESSSRLGPVTALGLLDEVPTDRQGRFVLEGIAPGPMELLPAGEGFAGGEQTIEARLQPGAGIELTLEPATRIYGVVHRSDGTAASGAQVRGISEPVGGGETRLLERAATDGNGRFQMEGFGAGEVTLTAWSDREVTVQGPLPVQAGERKQVTLPLAPGAFVSGRVRWEDGQPAADIRVRCLEQKLNAGPGARHYDLPLPPAVTGADGSFTLGPFLPGRVHVFAIAPGERETWTSLPRPNQAQTIVTVGQRVGGLELVVSAGRHNIAGTTLGPDGKPLAGATLIAAREFNADRRGDLLTGPQQQTTSGGDGRFVLDGLASAPFTLRARHPDHPDLALSGVRAGASDVRVRFPRPAELSGVITTRSGTPVREGLVVVRFKSAGWSGPAGATTPGDPGPFEDWPRIDLKDRAGTFTLGRLAPGEYLVIVTAEGTLVANALFTVKEGEHKQVRLVARPGATVIGRVVDDATGMPVAGAQVSIGILGQERADTTDAGGAFTLKAVPAASNIPIEATFRRGSAESQARLQTPVPRGGVTVDAGTIRLRPARVVAAPAR